MHQADLFGNGSANLIGNLIEVLVGSAHPFDFINPVMSPDEQNFK